jgi:hypothetical protein
MARARHIPSYDFIRLNQSVDGPLFVRVFRELLQLTDTYDNVERFFSIMFVLEILSEQLNPSNVLLDDDQIRNALVDDSLLHLLFKNRKDMLAAKRILEYYLEHRKEYLMVCPRNLRTFFHECLRDYLHVSLPNCLCDYHAKLFSLLEPDDVVVSFNYDEVADYTLHAIGRLTPRSLDNLGFTDYVFPNDSYSNECVRLLKVHGSMNWWTDIENFGDVFYNLIPASSNKELKGNTPFPIVLPFLNKELFYRKFPVLEKHFDLLRLSLKQCHVVFLVGKSFLNTDSELVAYIQDCCVSHKRELYLIDPKTTESSFRDFHATLFNATLARAWSTMAHFYEDQDLA